MTGSFTVAGVSAHIVVRALNSISILVAPAAGETFNGVVILEQSLTHGASWEQAVNSIGDPVEWDGTSVSIDDTEAARVQVNTVPNSRCLYRLRCTDPGDEDGIGYTIDQVTGDIVGIVLRDDRFQPLISRRDDGGMVFHHPVVFEGEVTEQAGNANLLPDSVEEFVELITISAADIVDTAAGKFGHAAGYPLVADPGAGKIAELVSATVVFDRATAAYTDGGNITINENGGAALTGLVSAANSLGAATDKVATFVPLAAAATVRTVNKGLNLVTSAAFTQPGTAAGVVRAYVRYRIVTTGL
jgi:hypothetical protein